jgi:hypothetical protein
MKAIKNLSVGIVITFLLISSIVRAQLVSGGIAAGVSTGSVKLEDVPSRFTDVVNGRNITGYELGAFAKIKAGPVYVKPMALFGYQTGHVMVDDEQVTYRSNRFAVPLLLGYNVIGPLSIEAGPVYNYLGDVTRNFENMGDTWDVKQNGLGYRAGLVADFGPLMLNATFEGLTYDLGDSDRPGLKEPAKIILGAGFTFGRMGNDKKD